jgi:hypothetical protein
VPADNDFDGAGLLRRLDYSVDILGGDPAVHYPSAYREFDGIKGSCGLSRASESEPFDHQLGDREQGGLG